MHVKNKLPSAVQNPPAYNTYILQSQSNYTFIVRELFQDEGRGADGKFICILKGMAGVGRVASDQTSRIGGDFSTV